MEETKQNQTAQEEPKREEKKDGLQKISEDERKKIQAGKTTIHRERQIKLLESISNYLFLILLVLSLSVAMFFGHKVSSFNQSWFDTAFTLFMTVILGIVTYAVHHLKLQDTIIGQQIIEKVDEAKKTIFGRK